MLVRCVAAIPTVENAWARGQKLVLYGVVYGMQDGLLRDLGPTLASAAERDALISMATPQADRHPRRKLDCGLPLPALRQGIRI